MIITTINSFTLKKYKLNLPTSQHIWSTTIPLSKLESPFTSVTSNNFAKKNLATLLVSLALLDDQMRFQ